MPLRPDDGSRMIREDHVRCCEGPGVQSPRSTRPYPKVIVWGWFYLSTILDDFAWKLCATMKAEDVSATLNLALKASGLDQAKVIHRPRLLSDNVLRAEGDRIGGQSFSVREHALAA